MLLTALSLAIVFYLYFGVVMGFVYARYQEETFDISRKQKIAVIAKTTFTWPFVILSETT